LTYAKTKSLTFVAVIFYPILIAIFFLFRLVHKITIQLNKSKSQEEFYEIFTLKNILRPSVINAYDNNRSGTKDDTGKLINEGTKQEKPDSPDTKVNGLPISEQVKEQKHRNCPKKSHSNWFTNLICSETMINKWVGFRHAER